MANGRGYLRSGLALKLGSRIAGNRAVPCRPNVCATPLCPALVIATARLPWTRSDRALKRRLRHPIRSEVFGLFDCKEPGQALPRPVHPALDGADRHATDLGGLLIGQTLGHGQEQRFPVLDRELGERLEQVLGIARRMLLRRSPQAGRKGPVWVLDLAA